MASKYREPTHNALVERALREADDFLSRDMLVARGCGRPEQVSHALHYLRSQHVVDVVVNPDGTGWWFALPANLDTRSKHIPERAPEQGPRRTTRRKKHED